MLHNASFQKLEGTWRGLKYLLDQSETSDKLKIRVLNATKKELLRDLQRAPEFDQSALFKKVYEEEFGVFGGAPFAALVGDYEFGRGPGRHRAAGKRLQGRGGGACAIPDRRRIPEMLNLDSFTAIDAPARHGEDFRHHRIRQVEELPRERRFALRRPVPAAHSDAPALRQERRDAAMRSITRKPWMAATIPSTSGGMPHTLCGARLTNAFAQYGWCAAIRGVEGGGLVEGLPTHNFTTDAGDIALKCPTEAPITDRREKELADLGFIPLVHCKGTDYAAFFSVQSAQKAKMYDKDAANANARLSTQLPYILAISRFAHYMKAMMRDKIGSFMSRSRVPGFPEHVDLAVRGGE